MDNILLSAALAFVITYFSIPVIIQVAKSKKLFDEPDERKVHKVVIPTLGGLGIFAGFIIAMLMGLPPTSPAEFQYIAAASIVIFFLGIKDDILVLSASKKFIGQLIAAGILIKFGGIRINNMYGFLGMHEIPNVASIVLTMFTIIVITNSFNLIDGVDGLAGSLGLLTSITFGSYFFYIGELALAVVAFSMCGAVLSFLIYNFSPAKIFMGDTGSLMIGLINAVLVVKFINCAGNNYVFPISAAPAIGFAILMVPLLDTLRVFGKRLLERRSPFSPDRNHIHHFLLDLGFSHRKITITCVSVNLLFILLAFFLRNFDITLAIAVLIATGWSFTGIVFFFRQKSKRIKTEVKGSRIQSPKILTLADTVETE